MKNTAFKFPFVIWTRTYKWIVGSLLLLSFSTHCGGTKGNVEEAQGISDTDDTDSLAQNTDKMIDTEPVTITCPNLTSARAIETTDFNSEFGLHGESALKMKAVMSASLEINALAASLEGKLYHACSTMAQDLGYKPGNSIKSSCSAALKAVRIFKQKSGGQFSVHMESPICTVPMDAMESCASSCSFDGAPYSVDLQCEGGRLNGECRGRCTGRCELLSSAVCEGTCKGSCDENFTGSCDGKCEGHCNGRATRGQIYCQGTCKGQCLRGANGKCGGYCEGECDMSSLRDGGACLGTCTGNCSEKMVPVNCPGNVVVPNLPEECIIRCASSISSKTECSDFELLAKMMNPTDEVIANRLVSTVERYLPSIIKLSAGAGGRYADVSKDVDLIVGRTLDRLKTGEGEQVQKKASVCMSKTLKEASLSSRRIIYYATVARKVQATIRGENI